MYPNEFLTKLNKNKNRIIYAKIIALDINELPIESIEGRVTAGSINIDGDAAMRRTCSLTVVAENFNYTNYIWSLNTKFKLEIGVENTVDSNFPDIIWFNQGIYLITQFNTSSSTNNFTITINGKDKMCLLNGEISGSLESSIDFGKIEEEDNNGNWIIRQIPIQEIIRNLIHVYGKEPYHNIIINDLDITGLELLEYRYNVPAYFWREYEDAKGNEWSEPIYQNIMINDNGIVYYSDKPINDPNRKTTLGKLSIDDFENLLGDFSNTTDVLPTLFNFAADEELPTYILAKIEYGQTIGYRITDLTYAGDLIANIGESITSILDKIKNMLGEYEYFYNIDGQFVFQKKKAYLQTLWSPNAEDKDAAIAYSLMESNEDQIFSFADGELITAFNNNPNILNLRNDYSIWGQRTTASGAEIPIHMRYSINVKPTHYNTLTIDNENEEIKEYNQKYKTNVQGQESKTYSTILEDNPCDWREIIYRMALDYYKYGHFDFFAEKLIEANPDLIDGKTGYEAYYIDMQGFWRQLYYYNIDGEISDLNTKISNNIDKENVLIEAIEQQQTYIKMLELEIIEGTFKNQNVKEKIQQAIEYQKQYESYKNELVACLEERQKMEKKLNELEESVKDYYLEDGDKKYWNKNVFEKPELLNFWIDFLDEDGDIQNYNIQSIGARSKSINDTNVKAIYFRETPQVIFYEPGSNITNISTAYRAIQIPKNQMETMFSISSKGLSAKDKLDELLYQFGYCIENATITSIPIYYLEPNSRIYLYDEKTKLNGYYIAKKITLPLTHNGTMQITAMKITENNI